MVKIVRRIVPTFASDGKLYAKGKHRNAYIGSVGTNRKKYIAVHQTGNTSRGANADMHGKLQMNGNTRTAGWPYSVDDIHAVQSFEHDAIVFHAGDHKGNREAIGVEICVNQDGDYLKALQNGAALVKHIMKVEGIPLSNVVQHNYYSGKNCPSHLRRAYKGVSWLDFKNMVQGAPSVSKPVVSVAGTTTKKSVEQLAQEVMRGLHGTGDARKKALGSQYSAVQRRVNQLAGGSNPVAPKPVAKSVDQLAKEVIDGKHGQGEARKKALGSQYSAVQAKVNAILGGSKPQGKSIDQLAREVIAGKHGNGHAQRQKSLGISNAEYQKVRARVNSLSR